MGKIVDFFRRVEFQLRGTPHYHILVSVKHDGIDKTFIESLDTEIQNKVKELMKGVFTANLVSPSNAEDLQEPYTYYAFIENENRPTNEPLVCRSLLCTITFQ